IIRAHKKHRVVEYLANKVRQDNPRSFTNHGRIASSPILEITEEHDEIDVYCLNVEDTHTFITTGGIAVHNCIKIDPYYLTWKAKEFGYTDHFLELAADVNENMPRFVRSKVSQALNMFSKPIRGSKVLILGAAYKPDISDLRESAAYPVMTMLEEDGAELIYHDPHCSTIELPNGKQYQHSDNALEAEQLEEVDCVILLTNHSCFNYQHIADHASLIVDTRNAFAKVRGKAKVVKA
ncbi:hypothetical protein LCGC14_2533070, partial [marine sediment metagenome]